MTGELKVKTTKAPPGYKPGKTAVFIPSTGTYLPGTGTPYRYVDESGKTVMERIDTNRLTETTTEKSPVEKTKSDIPERIPVAPQETRRDIGQVAGIRKIEDITGITAEQLEAERVNEVRKYYESLPLEGKIAIRSRATPFGPAGWEGLGSLIVPGDTPKEVALRQFSREAEMAKAGMTYPEYLLYSTQNPALEVAGTFAGFKGVGALAKRYQRVGAAVTSKTGKALGIGLGAGYVGLQGMETSGDIGKGEFSRAAGRVMQTGATLLAAGKGFRSGYVGKGGEYRVKAVTGVETKSRVRLTGLGESPGKQELKVSYIDTLFNKPRLTEYSPKELLQLKRMKIRTDVAIQPKKLGIYTREEGIRPKILQYTSKKKPEIPKRIQFYEKGERSVFAEFKGKGSKLFEVSKTVFAEPVEPPPKVKISLGKSSAKSIKALYKKKGFGTRKPVGQWLSESYSQPKENPFKLEARPGDVKPVLAGKKGQSLKMLDPGNMFVPSRGKPIPLEYEYMAYPPGTPAVMFGPGVPKFRTTKVTGPTDNFMREFGKNTAFSRRLTDTKQPGKALFKYESKSFSLPRSREKLTEVTRERAKERVGTRTITRQRETTIPKTGMFLMPVTGSSLKLRELITFRQKQKTLPPPTRTRGNMFVPAGGLPRKGGFNMGTLRTGRKRTGRGLGNPFSFKPLSVTKKKFRTGLADDIASGILFPKRKKPVKFGAFLSLGRKKA